ncbi:MAG: LPS assembly lipoprotein LptE [Marinibacterium sp.]
MWSRRQLLLAALPALAAGCGFEPVYAPGNTGSALYGRVTLDIPDDRDAYLFVQNVEQALGRAQDPQFRLAYHITTRDTGQAITATGDITRYNLIGVAAYQLIRLSDDAVIAKGRVDNFTGYSATGSTVDTLAAERDAARRLMVILADQTVEQLFLLPDLAP